MEALSSDLTSWVIGPYHQSLPEPMRLHLSLDGEIVCSARVETGYLHRGLEKGFELHSWFSALPYADHLDPEGAIFGELAFCLGVEQICQIVVPPRAESIRIILAELTRISSYLANVAKTAHAVVSETTVHYVLRDREKILDLFELLTGARFSLNFLRYGGVACDVTEGFIERVLETCDLIRVRLKEYNDLFSFNYAFRERTEGLSRIHGDQIRRLGLSGPNARATGIPIDIRKSHPYSGYHRLDFEVQTGHKKGESDVHDRFLLRLREINQSLELLRQVADHIPVGDFNSVKAGKDFLVPAGEAYVRIESSRGLLGCHVASDGTEKPSRVQFRTPSQSLLLLVPELLVGARLEDVPLIINSLDPGIAEVDR